MFIAIVPAYNEEKTVGSVVRNLFRHVDMVVVVDDGSADKTAEFASAAGAVVLKHELNRGQGAALETGHEYARRIGAEYVLHFDADGQFCADDVLPALSHIKKNNAQVLFGSRFLDSRSGTPWLKRHIFFPIAGLVHRFFGGANLSDVHNGFRIIRHDALKKIKLNQDKMAHATEIQALVKRYEFDIVEFPVKVEYFTFGQSIRGGINIVRDLILDIFLRK